MLTFLHIANANEFSNSTELQVSQRLKTS